MQDSSDEEEESGVSDGWSQSTGRGVSASMQTSLTRNQSASVQTEAIGVDAETLVDEFFTDDSEKKVWCLLWSAKAVLVSSQYVYNFMHIDDYALYVLDSDSQTGLTPSLLLASRYCLCCLILHLNLDFIAGFTYIAEDKEDG